MNTNIFAEDEPYETVSSIGSHCLTSLSLKNAGLKRFSGPFDWIFSSIEMVCDCIEDRFEAFLDQQYYAKVPEHERSSPDLGFCDHALYRDRYGIGHIFNHDDPTIPENYDYLVRCAARANALLTSNERHLLLGFCVEGRSSESSFERLCRILDHTPGVDAVVISLNPIAEQPDLTLTRRDSRHRLYAMTPTSPMTGINFVGHADNLMVGEILSHIRLSQAQ